MKLTEKMRTELLGDPERLEQWERDWNERNKDSFRKEIPFPGDICSFCNPITPETKLFKHDRLVLNYCLQCHKPVNTEHPFSQWIENEAENLIIDCKNSYTGAKNIFLPSKKECTKLNKLRKAGNKCPKRKR